MSDMVNMIGIHGKMGSGKDVLFKRLQLRNRNFRRHSFADPLKRSAAALLGLTVEQLEHVKRDDGYGIGVGPRSPGMIHTNTRDFTIREFLQRYGTEAHRDVFGQGFWVEQAMREVVATAQRIQDENSRSSDPLGYIPVFTDVRFENEAKAIIRQGGCIIHVIGSDSDTGDHASEKLLGVELIDYVVSNEKRDDDFASLDKVVDSLLEQWGMA
jgi:hypothetical protein